MANDKADKRKKPRAELFALPGSYTPEVITHRLLNDIPAVKHVAAIAKMADGTLGFYFSTQTPEQLLLLATALLEEAKAEAFRTFEDV